MAGLRSRRLFHESLEERTLLSVAPQLIDLNPSGASSPSEFVEVGSVTFFVAEEATHGRELWKTDGTAAGTSRVADIRPGAGSSNPHGLVEFNGEVYFTADDGVNGRELWKSNGLAGGTVMVKHINPGAGHGLATSISLVNVNGTLFFAADDGTHGNELWKSNGNSGGTEMVKDIFAGAATDHSNPLDLTAVGNTLFFTADDGTSGRELWKSDGSPGGTEMVKDIGADGDDGLGESALLTNVNGTLFFVADDGEHGNELWKSNGDPAGTEMVEDIGPDGDDGLSASSLLTNVNGTLFFAANDGTHGNELWKSDGDEAGTEMVQDILTGVRDGLTADSWLTNFNGTLFFAADNGLQGAELWKSNGDPTGTILVKDIYPGREYFHDIINGMLVDGFNPYSSSPKYLTDVDGVLYFSAEDGSRGNELWMSDGTPEGTLPVYDLLPGAGSSSPQSLAYHDGTLLFSADDGLAARELWTLDPDAEETERVAQLTIYIDGQQEAIPANIGIAAGGTQLSQVHTVDADGTLRIEPIAGEPLEDVTLGDFFETWRNQNGQAYNPNAVFNEGEILGHEVDGHMIQLFVNGQANRQFEEYVIRDGDEIVIVYTANEVVSINTNVGPILIELYADDTPLTVANFLKYVNDGDYINAFFHRSAELSSTPPTPPEDFVIQIGASTTPNAQETDPNEFTDVPTDPAVPNEPGIPNTEGTVAMAKLGGDPNSATSQFFVNMRDNRGAPAYLDTQNGGFTVFGKVLNMAVSHQIADFDVSDLDPGDFNNNGTEDDDKLYDVVPLTDDDELVVIQSIGGEGYLSGRCFADNNGDGVQDAIEFGLEGVTVFVDANDNGALDAGEASTTTDSLGHWQLRLAAGSYVVRQLPLGSLLAPTTPDGTGSHTATVQIGSEVDGLHFANTGNSAPVGAADGYQVAEDGKLTKSSPNEGVLNNDADADGHTMTAVLVDNVQDGDLEFNDDGTFTYTPAPDFHGQDEFTYRAQDPFGQSAKVTAEITVTPVSDAPVAENDEYPLTEGDQTHELPVLENDTDPDGPQGLTITEITQYSGSGTVDITSDGLKIEYTPAPGFYGTETFDYTVEDPDGLSDTATVTVTVADPVGSISGYVYRDTDGDGDREQGEAGIYGVRVTLTGVDNHGNDVNTSVLTSAEGLYRFVNLLPGTYEVTEQQPMAFWDGQDRIGTAGGVEGNDHFSEIELGPGQHSTENNFGEEGLGPDVVNLGLFVASAQWQEYLPKLMVKAEKKAGNTDLADLIDDGLDNQPPVAEDDSYEVNEDQALVKSAGDGVQHNDSDPDGDTLIALVETEPQNGLLVLRPGGSFTYRPDAEFNGPDSFTYTVTDGILVSDPAEVTITVNAVNDAPVAEDDSYTVDEDQTLTKSLADGLLKNDSDPEGDTLTVSVDTGPDNGILVPQPGGSFTYTPNDDFHGIDTFTYTLSDGALVSNTAEVTITVDPVNDAPVAEDDSYTVDEDQTLTKSLADGVQHNDSDPDGDVLTVSVDTGPANGILVPSPDGSFTYTPNDDFNGIDTFTYTLSDGTLVSNTATVTITVDPVNDAPVAEDDAYHVAEGGSLQINRQDGVLSNDTDVDGTPPLPLNSLRITEINYNPHGPTQAEAEIDPNLTNEHFEFIELENVGEETIDLGGVRFTEGIDFEFPTASSTVLAPGDVILVVADLDAFRTRYGQEPNVVGEFGVGSLDNDGERIVLEDSAGQTIHEFTYDDQDPWPIDPDGLDKTLEVLDVAGDYDDPGNWTASAQPGGTPGQGTGMTLAVDYLMARLVDEPEHGTVFLFEDGSFNYTPDPSWPGADSFTYRASDGADESNLATVEIELEEPQP